ncbi:MAG: HupE/UreJ family protein [Gammaproteobacteria bacterium]|nr:HupE/UreJ family protein [Gammaproteobacteria bacterium]
MVGRRWLIGCLLAALWLPAAAHELNLARFELRQGAEPDAYQLVALIQNPPARAFEAELDWPPACVELDRREYEHGGRLRVDVDFGCEGGLAGDMSLRTPWGVDGGLFTHAAGPGPPVTTFLPGRMDGMRLPIGQAESVQRPLAEVGRGYTAMGVFHILEGWDHLAFVLCLCMLAGGRALLWLVTAFTLGHSVSLALAYLGHLDLPMPPVEAVIALSVAFMAREAIKTRRSVGQAASGQQLLLVTGFGLLHGLGFASELAGLGVGGGERITGLFAFNLGVEIGQLLFVALMLLLLAAADLLRWRAGAERLALIGAGILGMYWFAERIAGLFVQWQLHQAGGLPF